MASSLRRVSAAVSVFACALGLAMVLPSAAALAGSVSTPTGLTVTFSTWFEGQSELSVSWTPISGVDGYEVDFASGATAPTSPGAGAINVVGADSGTTPLPVNGTGQVSVSLWAYTGSPGNFSALSQPASQTLVVPGAPALSATPVSGLVGAADLTWSAPAIDGDTLVLREGEGAGDGPSGGTAVSINQSSNSTEVVGLPSYLLGTGTPMVLYELNGTNADDWSPVTQSNFLYAYGAPGPEAGAGSNDTDDALHLHLSWEPPICQFSWQTCSNSVVVENMGTKVAADPADGTLETDPAGIANGAGVTISDLTPGQQYTFTVFDVEMINGVKYWSQGATSTTTDLAYPAMTLTASPAATVTAGQQVTLTSKLTTVGTNPTGVVTFRTLKSVLCSKVPVPATHVVQCHTAATAIGANGPTEPRNGYDVYAVYSGDSTDGSNSSNLVMTYDKAKPGIRATLTGQRTKKVVIKAVVGGPAGPGTGSLTMVSGSHHVCTAILRSGEVTCVARLTAIGAGRHAMVIKYSGSVAYVPASKTVEATFKK